MDAEPEEVLAGRADLTGVDAHAHANRGGAGPRVRGERALRVDRGGDGGPSGRERDEEAVALRALLNTAVRRDCGTHERAVVEERDLVFVGAERAQRPGRPLDVGEQQHLQLHRPGITVLTTPHGAPR